VGDATGIPMTEVWILIYLINEHGAADSITSIEMYCTLVRDSIDGYRNADRIAFKDIEMLTGSPSRI
jgi:hypothetical protein